MSVFLTQNLECILHDMVAESAEVQRQVQSKTQQLMRKEAELTRAEETIRREQQQIQEMVRLMDMFLDIVIPLPLCYIYRERPSGESSS